MEGVEESKNIENITNNSVVSKGKEKKPRTEKQLEAFKRCAEKRKQKLLDKQNSIQVDKKEKEVNQQLLLSLMDQINQLKNEHSRVLQQSNAVVESIPTPAPAAVPLHTPINNDRDMHHHHHNHQTNTNEPVYRPYHPPNPSHQPTMMELGCGMGYNVSGGRKRDVRGMDPYADERQGMMEKVYARNVNIEKQREMERMQRFRFADENSIQLLSNKQNQSTQDYTYPDSMEIDNNQNHDVHDARGRIEMQAQNMSTMIRTGGLTNQARKAGAIAFNGLRVASRR